VQQLLGSGHSVRATVRTPAPPPHLVEWQARVGAARLDIRTGLDLAQADGVDEAVQGCDCLIHTAARFPPSIATSEEARLVISSCVQGTQNVMLAASRTGVKTVVITSSMAAVRGPADRPRDGRTFFDHRDWNRSSRCEKKREERERRKAEKGPRKLAKRGRETCRNGCGLVCLPGRGFILLCVGAGDREAACSHTNGRKREQKS
jgi:nucleoside-diphosphate-sugar epimerase